MDRKVQQMRKVSLRMLFFFSSPISNRIFGLGEVSKEGISKLKVSDTNHFLRPVIYVAVHHMDGCLSNDRLGSPQPIGVRVEIVLGLQRTGIWRFCATAPLLQRGHFFRSSRQWGCACQCASFTWTERCKRLWIWKRSQWMRPRHSTISAHHSSEYILIWYTPTN